MKPRRTHHSDKVFRLPGGTEDNDLWATVYPADANSGPALGSVWVPTDEERQAIADGENIELIVWGTGHPPVAMRTTDVEIGRAPDEAAA